MIRETIIHYVYCSSAFHQDCQCKTESLMHRIIIFDVKYGQHQWETVSRASRCHFHHQPIPNNQLHWSIKKVCLILLYCCKYQLIVLICLYQLIVLICLHQLIVLICLICYNHRLCILHIIRLQRYLLFLRDNSVIT